MSVVCLRTWPTFMLAGRGAWAGVPTAGHKAATAVCGARAGARGARAQALCLMPAESSAQLWCGVCMRGPPRMGRGRARQAERWALVGNAVSVPVARWLGARLAQPHRHKYFLGAKDRRMPLETCAAHSPLATTICIRKFAWCLPHGHLSDLSSMNRRILPMFDGLAGT